MIICNSGSGNTRVVANKLQEALGDEIMRLPPGLMVNPSKAKLHVYDQRVIWAFPVHVWSLPWITLRCIRQITLTSNTPVKHYLVCTCGDDIGNTEKVWRKEIKKRGWDPAGAFSVQMPNNFTFWGNYDVDPPELQKRKLDALDDRLKIVIDSISKGERTVDVVRGSFPWIKTSIINPWFLRNKMNTKPFHTNDDCTGCGFCAQNCPITNIAMVDGRPKWGDTCIMCTRCYQVCPRHALHFGTATEGKGQYMCPGYVLRT